MGFKGAGLVSDIVECDICDMWTLGTGRTGKCGAVKLDA